MEECRCAGEGGACECWEGGYVIDAHTIRHLATLQPRVPAPSKRHLVCAMAERSRDGRRRQRISFRLRSTEDSANLERERREWWRECKRKEVATSGGRELQLQLAIYCCYKYCISSINVPPMSTRTAPFHSLVVCRKYTSLHGSTLSNHHMTIVEMVKSAIA